MSDRANAGERDDASGPALSRRLTELGYEVGPPEIVADGVEAVHTCLIRICEESAVDLVLTTGGSGMAPRDQTPEATLQLAERQVPGLMELARRRCAEHTSLAALGRGVAVIRGSSLIVNLPGNPKAALETLESLVDVLPHALTVLTRTPSDCELTGKGGRGEGSPS